MAVSPDSKLWLQHCDELINVMIRPLHEAPPASHSPHHEAQAKQQMVGSAQRARFINQKLVSFVRRGQLVRL
jgi:hypothetical protein